MEEVEVVQSYGKMYSMHLQAVYPGQKLHSLGENQTKQNNFFLVYIHVHILKQNLVIRCTKVCLCVLLGCYVKEKFNCLFPSC